MNRVKEIYEELAIPQTYKRFEENSYELICSQILQLSGGLPHRLFFRFLKTMTGRWADISRSTFQLIQLLIKCILDITDDVVISHQFGEFLNIHKKTKWKADCSGNLFYLIVWIKQYVSRALINQIYCEQLIQNLNCDWVLPFFLMYPILLWSYFWT